jgi:hypothetical protein
LTGKNGAWKRQFDGWVDPRWAGAAVDGTTDDTGAYHAVRSLVDVLGYPLRIPPGRSILTGKLAFTDAVVIEGAAAGRSFLRWPASVTGIGATNRIGIDISGVSQAVRSERLKVEGISFERAGAAPGVSGRALTVRCLACEPSVGSILPSVVLNDLEFTGLQVKTQSFQWGIHLNEVQGAFVDNVSYRGSFDTSYPTVRYGTAIRADNVEGGNPFGLMVSKLVVLTAQFGVDIQESEGAKITGSDLVAVNTGIRWRPGVVGVGQPGLTVMGNHINAYDYGIDAKGNHQAIISDNLIYRRPDANGAFACVRLTDARFPSVGRNLCADANPTVGTRSVGIEFVNVDHYLIAPNNFQLGDTCISVDENSDGGTIDFQQIRTDAWTTLLDYSGSGARIRGRGGYATVATGAALTLVPWRDPETIRHVGRLKADETVTLSTANAYPGANFRISREGGGAFHLNVGPGPLCSLARGDWCVVVYDGSAWYRAEAGSRF